MWPIFLWYKFIGLLTRWRLCFCLHMRSAEMSLSCFQNSRHHSDKDHCKLANLSYQEIEHCKSSQDGFFSRKLHWVGRFILFFIPWTHTLVKQITRFWKDYIFSRNHKSTILRNFIKNLFVGLHLFHTCTLHCTIFACRLPSTPISIGAEITCIIVLFLDKLAINVHVNGFCVGSLGSDRLLNLHGIT